MGKRQKLYNIRSKMMCDIEQVSLLLKFLTQRAETLTEAVILAEIALGKNRYTAENNERLGKILKL